MSTLSKFSSFVLVAIVAVAATGCVSRKAAAPAVVAAPDPPTATLQLHISHSQETQTVAGKPQKFTNCFVEGIPVDVKGKFDPTRVPFYDLYPDERGNVAVRVAPGFYRIRLHSTHAVVPTVVSETVVHVSAGRTVALALDANPFRHR